jgi:DnaJ-domain-containing protein 1
VQYWGRALGEEFKLKRAYHLYRDYICVLSVIVLAMCAPTSADARISTAGKCTLGGTATTAALLWWVNKTHPAHKGLTLRQSIKKIAEELWKSPRRTFKRYPTLLATAGFTCGSAAWWLKKTIGKYNPEFDDLTQGLPSTTRRSWRGIRPVMDRYLNTSNTAHIELVTSATYHDLAQQCIDQFDLAAKWHFEVEVKVLGWQLFFGASLNPNTGINEVRNFCRVHCARAREELERTHLAHMTALLHRMFERHGVPHEKINIHIKAFEDACIFALEQQFEKYATNFEEEFFGRTQPGQTHGNNALLQLDPYAVLGIPSTAPDNEVKKAYRKLALKWHPDKNQGDKQAEEQFKKITGAYEIILQRRGMRR